MPRGDRLSRAVACQCQRLFVVVLRRPTGSSTITVKRPAPCNGKDVTSDAVFVGEQWTWDLNVGRD